MTMDPTPEQVDDFTVTGDELDLCLDRAEAAEARYADLLTRLEDALRDPEPLAYARIITLTREARALTAADAVGKDRARHEHPPGMATDRDCPACAHLWEDPPDVVALVNAQLRGSRLPEPEDHR